MSGVFGEHCGTQIDWELKQHWDALCNRDTSYPEISASGVLSTQYDLKQEIGAYKRAIEKEKYVARKSGQGDQANTILNTNVSPAQELTWNQVKMREKNSVDASKTNLASGTPIFTWPTSGPLPEMVDSWQKDGVSIVDGLSGLIQKRKYEKHRITLLEILRQIKNNFIHKKGHKRVNKFINLLTHIKTFR